MTSISTKCLLLSPPYLSCYLIHALTLSPGKPSIPGRPSSPFSPLKPGTPVLPCSPGIPGKPVTPRSPSTPVTQDHMISSTQVHVNKKSTSVVHINKNQFFAFFTRMLVTRIHVDKILNRYFCYPETLCSPI